VQGNEEKEYALSPSGRKGVLLFYMYHLKIPYAMICYFGWNKKKAGSNTAVLPAFFCIFYWIA